MELQKIARFLSCIAPTNEQIVGTLSSAGLEEESLRQLYKTAVQRLAQTLLDERSVASAFRTAFPSIDPQNFPQGLSETKGASQAMADIGLDPGPKRHASLEIAGSGGGARKASPGDRTLFRRLRVERSDEENPLSECTVQNGQRNRESHRERNFRRRKDSASTQTADGGRGRRSSETDPRPPCSTGDSPGALGGRRGGAPATPRHLYDRSGGTNERASSSRDGCSAASGGSGTAGRGETSREGRRLRRKKGRARESRIARSAESPSVRPVPPYPGAAGRRTKRRSRRPVKNSTLIQKEATDDESGPLRSHPRRSPRLRRLRAGNGEEGSTVDPDGCKRKSVPHGVQRVSIKMPVIVLERLTVLPIVSSGSAEDEVNSGTSAASEGAKLLSSTTCRLRDLSKNPDRASSASSKAPDRKQPESLSSRPRGHAEEPSRGDARGSDASTDLDPSAEENREDDRSLPAITDDGASEVSVGKEEPVGPRSEVVETRELRRNRGGGAGSETVPEGGAEDAPLREDFTSSVRSPHPQGKKLLGDRQLAPENDARTPREKGESSGWICKGPVQARKKPRRCFTRLQEEALVYGVLKYGTSNWRTILQKGGFDGRESRELQDKYRNLQKFGHLPELEKAVHEQLKRGCSPLQRLRAADGSRPTPERLAGARVVYEPLVARNISGFRSAEPATTPARRKRLWRLSSSGDESDRSATDATKKVFPKGARPVVVDDDDTDVEEGHGRLINSWDTTMQDATRHRSAVDVSETTAFVGAENRVEPHGSARSEIDEERARGGGRNRSPTETHLQATEERENLGPHVTNRSESAPETVVSDGGLSYRVLPRDTLIDEDFPPSEPPQKKPERKETFVENDEGKQRKRNFFTKLEEEALVHGVILYGRGNWAVIKRAGEFRDRTVIQLSDKYRNLVKYDHLRRLKNVVEGKLASGENPLRKLRESYDEPRIDAL